MDLKFQTEQELDQENQTRLVTMIQNNPLARNQLHQIVQFSDTIDDTLRMVLPSIHFEGLDQEQIATILDVFEMIRSFARASKAVA